MENREARARLCEINSRIVLRRDRRRVSPLGDTVRKSRVASVEMTWLELRIGGRLG
jgi:hypothetical protein